MEKEVLDFVREKGEASIAELARHIKVSYASTYGLVCLLIEQGKLKQIRKKYPRQRKIVLGASE